MSLINTAERVSLENIADNWVLKRSELAYVKAKEMVAGKIAEIGCGNAYYVNEILPNCDEYLLIDKTKTLVIDELTKLPKVQFFQATIPPLTFIPDNSVDYVLCFQVIEHIKQDTELVKEVYRILKPGGQFLVTTPNRLMSLSRNPWHIREYTPDELKQKLGTSFKNIECNGVFGKDKAMVYYDKNKKSVAQFRKWDVFGFEKKLPAALYRIPYDIMNQLNRKSLQKKTGVEGLNVETFRVDDFYVDTVTNQCLDLYYIAKK